MERPTAVDQEHLFEGRVIISETDEKGIITYANRKFCEIAGYSADELKGQPHNIIRHPDMPKAAFAQMWETIKGGRSWHGIVKNLRKDGLYYWVETEITPVKNSEGTITGYIAARKPASRKNIDEISQTYRNMLEKEK
jgi:aerotaxis receptor